MVWSQEDWDADPPAHIRRGVAQAQHAHKPLPTTHQHNSSASGASSQETKPQGVTTRGIGRATAGGNGREGNGRGQRSALTCSIPQANPSSLAPPVNRLTHVSRSFQIAPPRSPICDGPTPTPPLRSEVKMAGGWSRVWRGASYLAEHDEPGALRNTKYKKANAVESTNHLRATML